MKNVINVIIILLGALIVMKAFFWVVEKFQNGDNELSLPQSTSIQGAKVKDLTVKEQGYGVNVIAEIQNLTSKEIKFCEVTFTWHDKEGKLIDSAIGMGKNIKPNSTGIVDRYFDGIPKGEGATCKAAITDVTFD